MKNGEKTTIKTTLGELIAAASEVAFEYSENDREAYNLAQLALVELLRNNQHKQLNSKFKDFYAASEISH